MWQHWLGLILGLWIIAVPFLGMAESTLMWSLIITGAVIVGLSLWEAQEVASEREAGRMVPQH